MPNSEAIKIETDFLPFGDRSVLQLDTHAVCYEDRPMWFNKSHKKEVHQLLSQAIHDHLIETESNAKTGVSRCRKDVASRPIKQPVFSDPQILTGETLRLAYSFKVAHRNGLHSILTSIGNQYRPVSLHQEKLVVYVHLMKSQDKSTLFVDETRQINTVNHISSYFTDLKASCKDNDDPSSCVIAAQSKIKCAKSSHPKVVKGSTVASDSDNSTTSNSSVKNNLDDKQSMDNVSYTNKEVSATTVVAPRINVEPSDSSTLSRFKFQRTNNHKLLCRTGATVNNVRSSSMKMARASLEKARRSSLHRYNGATSLLCTLDEREMDIASTMVQLENNTPSVLTIVQSEKDVTSAGVTFREDSIHKNELNEKAPREIPVESKNDTNLTIKATKSCTFSINLHEKNKQLKLKPVASTKIRGRSCFDEDEADSDFKCRKKSKVTHATRSLGDDVQQRSSHSVQLNLYTLESNKVRGGANGHVLRAEDDILDDNASVDHSDSSKSYDLRNGSSRGKHESEAKVMRTVRSSGRITRDATLSAEENVIHATRDGIDSQKLPVTIDTLQNICSVTNVDNKSCAVEAADKSNELENVLNEEKLKAIDVDKQIGDILKPCDEEGGNDGSCANRKRRREEDGKNGEVKTSGVIVIDDEEDEAQECEKLLQSVKTIDDLSPNSVRQLVLMHEPFLRDIFQGKTLRPRHIDYRAGGKKRSALSFTVLECLYSDDQKQEVMSALTAIFCRRHNKYFDYLLRVLMPEMLIKLFQLVSGETNADKAERTMNEMCKSRSSLSQSL